MGLLNVYVPLTPDRHSVSHYPRYYLGSMIAFQHAVFLELKDGQVQCSLYGSSLVVVPSPHCSLFPENAEIIKDSTHFPIPKNCETNPFHRTSRLLFLSTSTSTGGRLSACFQLLFNPLEAFFQIHQFAAFEEMADDIVGRQALDPLVFAYLYRFAVSSHQPLRIHRNTRHGFAAGRTAPGGYHNQATVGLSSKCETAPWVYKCCGDIIAGKKYVCLQISLVVVRRYSSWRWNVTGEHSGCLH